MAINLLGNNPLAVGTMSASTPAVNTTPSLAAQIRSYSQRGLPSVTTSPLGIQAKTPNVNVPVPATTLPKAQQQPLASKTLSSSGTGLTNDQVIANSTAAAQNAAKAIGGSYSPATGYIAGSTQTGTQQASTGTTAPQTPSFGGYLGQLVSQNQSQPSQSVNTAVNTLQGTAATNPGASGTAYNNYLADQAQYAKDLMAYNNTENGLRTQQGIPLEFQTGRAGAFQLLNSGRLAAEQAAVQNDLAGIGQNISGVQAQQAGANQAGGLANTQNAQQIGALGTAVNAVQPQLGSYGQTYYQPLQAGQAGQGNLDPQTQAASLAQRVMNGDITYDQAMQSLGYAGNIGATFLNNAITSAGGNPLALQSQGAGQQSVLSTIPALQSADSAAQGIANKITTFLAQNPQLNASNATIANAAQQWLQGKQLADPAYQTLFNYLNEYTNTLAPILGVGGDATNLKTQIAQGMINAQANGQSITQVLQNMGKLASDKVRDLASGAMGQGTVSSGGTGIVQTNVGAINTDW